MKRRVLILVVVLAIVGAAAGYWLAGPGLDRTTTVRGVVGSEKVALFADPRVQNAFTEHGLRVEVDARGSREMAGTVPLGRYDFAFPSSEPVAEAVRRARPATAAYEPFTSPLAVATFTPIVDLLAARGAAKRTATGYWTLDLRAYLDLADRDVRWDQLPGNIAYPARRDILLTTSDPENSNSAAGYAWLAATELGDGRVDTTDEALMTRVTRLFADQGGGLDRSTEDPFEKYVVQGLDFAPLVLVYEAQYVGSPALPRQATLLYLSPTLSNTHTVLAYTSPGDEVGRLLATDPDLQRLAAEHGFRTADPTVFAPILARVSAGGAALPQQSPESAAPPDATEFESLLTVLTRQLKP